MGEGRDRMRTFMCVCAIGGADRGEAYRGRVGWVMAYCTSAKLFIAKLVNPALIACVGRVAGGRSGREKD